MTSRKYSSDLRDAQAEATRARILDSLVEVLADGVDTLTVPAVAKQAGVSVGTVYRHFGDKAGMLRALIPHTQRRTGIEIDTNPETLDDMGDVVRQVFRHYEKTDDLLRAAMTSRAGRAMRVQGSAERLELMGEAFEKFAPDLDTGDIEHLAKVGLILTTSDAYQQWKDRLGLSPDEAADEVVWVIKTLIRGISS